MRGGLSRSIQTCFKRQRQSRRGSGEGGGWGGGHGHSGQPALTAGLTATSEKLTQEGKGRASGEVTRAPLLSPPPHSPAAPPPPISPPIATTSSPLQWGSPGAAPHVQGATIHACSLREFRSLTPQQGSTRPGPHRAAAQVFLLCHLPPPAPTLGAEISLQGPGRGTAAQCRHSSDPCSARQGLQQVLWGYRGVGGGGCLWVNGGGAHTWLKAS